MIPVAVSPVDHPELALQGPHAASMELVSHVDLRCAVKAVVHVHMDNFVSKGTVSRVYCAASLTIVETSVLNAPIFVFYRLRVAYSHPPPAIVK